MMEREYLPIDPPLIEEEDAASAVARAARAAAKARENHRAVGEWWTAAPDRVCIDVPLS